jgi:hypothetical protein
MKLILTITTEDGEVLLTHYFNYLLGKLKFIPGSGYMKTAIIEGLTKLGRI